MTFAIGEIAVQPNLFETNFAIRPDLDAAIPA
jgi:hypothetical protein